MTGRLRARAGALLVVGLTVYVPRALAWAQRIGGSPSPYPTAREFDAGVQERAVGLDAHERAVAAEVVKLNREQ